MVPLILDGPCTGVYYSTSPIPLTSGIPRAPALVQQCLSVTKRILLPFFSCTPSNIICLLTTLNPMTTVLYQQLTRLSSCVADLANSYASLRLQLNPTETEFILFGSRRNLAKLSDDCRAIIVGSSVIQCTDVVRDLGILL